MDEIRVVSLFSGIGAIDYGLRLAGGFRTVCYVEYEPYCQEVIKERQIDGRLDLGPIWDDVSTFDGEAWEGAEMVVGGFPCQDISNAGKCEGIDGERSGLWKEMRRIIREVGPRYVLVENVSALLVRGLERVLGDLAELGYDAEWRVLGACQFGAPHCRERVWIVAYPSGVGRSKVVLHDLPDKSSRKASFWASAHAGPLGGNGDWKDWEAKSGIQLVGDGFAFGVDRHHAIGNSVVPEEVEWIGRRIKGCA